MTLWEMQKAFKLDAELLGDYQGMTKTQLANGYCDAEEALEKAIQNKDDLAISENEILRSSYYSALMLRYWYKIFAWQKDSYSLNLEPTDFVDWESDALNYALKHKIWRVEGSVLFGDPNGPDKAINQCLGSMRVIAYQYHNKLKRKANTQTYSLDAMVDENGDSALDYLGCYTNNKRNDRISSLISLLIDKDEPLEALIVDGIANYETYKELKSKKVEKIIDDETGEEVDNEYDVISTSFDARKLVKHLNLIDENFIAEFCDTYSIPENKIISIYDGLKKLSNTKLYKMIEKTLIEIKQSPELLDCIY